MAAGAATGAVGAVGGAVGAAAAEGVVAGAAASQAAAITTGAVLSGPVGWLVLGKGGNSDNEWDCWKAVVRETDPMPSHGRLIKDVASDPRVAKVEPGVGSSILTITNVFDEVFAINMVVLPSGAYAAHALPMP
jgi:hypothetical protein